MFNTMDIGSGIFKQGSCSSCCFYRYRFIKSILYFKGKLGRGTRWIIGLCTLISVVVAQFGAIAIEMVQNDIPLQYESFVLLFSFPEITRSFIGNLALSLFMAFLGIIRLFINLKGNAKSVMPNIQK